MNEKRLEKYKQQLLEINERVESDIGNLNNEIATAGVIVGEHTSHTRDSIETDLALEANEESIQRDVQLAIQRIESGKFGKCEDCGGQILKARLDALPYTPICIGCERAREAS